MILPPITTETLVKYMLKVTERVERKVEKKLPSLFALVFDGWSVGQNYPRRRWGVRNGEVPCSEWACDARVSATRNPPRSVLVALVEFCGRVLRGRRAQVTRPDARAGVALGERVRSSASRVPLTGPPLRRGVGCAL